jgi:hypothetical protein
MRQIASTPEYADGAQDIAQFEERHPFEYFQLNLLFVARGPTLEFPR